MELTKEIKLQIRQLAEEKLRDGNMLVIIPKADIDDYAKMLEASFLNGELVLE